MVIDTWNCDTGNECSCLSHISKVMMTPNTEICTDSP